MKKRILCLALVMVMIFTLLPVSAFAAETVSSGTCVLTANAESIEFAGGSGTEADPYLIKTKEQLDNVRNHLDAHYKIVEDIVFSDADFAEGGIFYNDGSGWQPIGTSATPFSGTFDGGGHSISGMTITTGIEQSISVGLFGYSDGEIKNINMTQSDISIVGDSTVQSTSRDYAYIGSVIGHGSATNCNSSGSISISCNSAARSCYVYAGGVTGYGSATNCNNSCTLAASISSGSSRYAYVALGGICGLGHTIKKCNNTGKIVASTSRNDSTISVGGVAGIVITAISCTNNAKITTRGGFITTVNVGGICGTGGDGLSLSQSYNSGVIDGTSEARAGGIVGYLGGQGRINDSYNTGMIAGGSCGGILGESFNAVTINNCYNVGLIEDGYYKFTIYGSVTNSYQINNCYCLEGMAQINSSAISCTLDEMMLQATYSGFDFDTVWQMDIHKEYPWPMLQSISSDNSNNSIKDCCITLDKKQVQYHTPQPRITATYNGVELILNQDYIAKYIVGDDSWIASSYGNSNISGRIGVGSVLVIGVGNYYGIEPIEFEVTKYDISNAKLMTPWVCESDGTCHSSSYDLQDYEYDGTEKKQNDFRVCDYNDTIPSDCYDVSYLNNIDVGTATMLITGKGEYYTGTLEKHFQIYPGETPPVDDPGDKPPVNPFVDVSESSVYYDAILWAYYHEPQQITGGYTATEFRPGNPCTRGQVVTFLWRAAGCPEPTGDTSMFKDASSIAAPYQKAVAWAVEKGITTGFADGTFRPNDSVTRAQFVTFLWRYENRPATSGSIAGFTDAASIAEPYQQAVAWAVEKGITTGYNDGSFRPNATCTRWAVVLFMYRNMT